MQPTDLTGTYTYRSFLNEPDIVGDFNKLQFAEACPKPKRFSNFLG
jgi:hypothetical protein